MTLRSQGHGRGKPINPLLFNSSVMPARLTRVSPDGDTQEFDEEPWKKMEKLEGVFSKNYFKSYIKYTSI